ncbi:MAG TPA: flagellar basal body P-ring formation chaperone FlgA [Candidatus Paceibacterota bacterium]|nr:flagellar basal body P-ring formation chaperone FlgA [Verrucomicrobiota bacterium]HRY48070.1 flagellar basal body P-ring formation chaperone FlgA [Candidatus Paceibacterota bacterium]
MQKSGTNIAVILLTFLGVGSAQLIHAGESAPFSNSPVPKAANRTTAVSRIQTTVPNDRSAAPVVLVGAEGIYLADLLSAFTNAPVPHVRVGDAPAFGQTTVFPASKLLAVWRETSPNSAPTNSLDCGDLRVARRFRTLDEVEVREMLTDALQKEVVQERGELELRLGRAWTAVPVPEEPLELQFLDLPPRGLQSTFLVRFQLRTERELIGTWQMALQAKVLKPVWVTQTALRRGQTIGESDVLLEKRDILALREPLSSWMPGMTEFECASYLAAGTPLYARSVRPRCVVRRGDIVEASMQDGILTISLKVEVLEEGTPGQIIRVRNLQSKRELRAKVQNEQTVLIHM